MEGNVIILKIKKDPIVSTLKLVGITDMLGKKVYPELCTSQKILFVNKVNKQKKLNFAKRVLETYYSFR